MDVPAPAFRVTSSRDTQSSERETNSEALIRGLRVNENSSDPVQQMLNAQARAEWAEGQEAGAKKTARQVQSQTVRAKFHAPDVFERKAEANKPRQVRVFAPLVGEDEKMLERKTSGEDNNAERSDERGEGGSSHKGGKGLGKKLGGLFKRDKHGK